MCECTCGLVCKCQCVFVRVSVRLCECVWLWLCVCECMSLSVAVSVLCFFFIPTNYILWPGVLYVQISPNSKRHEYCTLAFLIKVFAFAETKPAVLLVVGFYHNPSKERTRAHTEPLSPAIQPPFHVSS
jgi:hypothetical protein